MKNLTPDQLRTALRSAPLPIQDVYLSEETADVIFDIKEQYKLHIDAAGELGSQVGYLLLGLMSPSEFFEGLVLTGINEQDARSIMDTLNERVFLPLQEEMRKPKDTSTDPEETLAPVSRVLPQVAAQERELLPPPALEYEPAVPRTLPGSPVPAPMPPDQVIKAPSTPIPVERPAVALEPTIQAAPLPQVIHHMPTAQHQPGWHPAAAVHIFVPTQGPMTHGQPMMASSQNVYVPVHDAPAALPSPQEPQREVPPIVPVVATHTATEAPLNREGRSDPYREPV